MKISTSKKALISSLLLTGVIQVAVAGSFISERAMSETVWNHCTEENVLIEGTMMLRGNTVESPSGVSAGNYTENAKNVKAIGLSSGDSYIYRHKVALSIHKLADNQLKVQHIDKDIALLSKRKSNQASDLVIEDIGMHYVFANDGSAVTSSIDFARSICE